MEIAYFLAKRQVLSGITDKDTAKARDRALSRLDSVLETAGADEDTGLPSWVVQSGIGPADGSPLE